MKPFFILILNALLALPVWAQEHEPDRDHDHDKDHAHDGDMEQQTATPKEIEEAIAAGGRLVEVKILGMVCDFCATALNKIFTRRDEVSAAYVDLDTKLLSVVLKPDEDLDDAIIERLVEQAGYKTASITRAPERRAGEGDEDDPS